MQVKQKQTQSEVNWINLKEKKIIWSKFLNS